MGRQASPERKCRYKLSNCTSQKAPWQEPREKEEQSPQAVKIDMQDQADLRQQTSSGVGETGKKWVPAGQAATKFWEYFAWQLHDDRRLLKEDHFVVNIANNEETGLSLFAIKRRLRPPTLDKRADILYNVSICQRRKLWKLVSEGIELAVAGTSDNTCTFVREPAPWLS